MKEFDNIIGYDAIKLELMRICDILVNPEKYAKLGVNIQNGLMLHGNPGVGKTLFANCFLKACKRKQYICRKDKPNGEFINHIKDVFEKAKQNAPSIILLDDLDKFANEDEDHKNAEEYVAVQSCIDEVKNANVFIIATANDLSLIPKSLLRAGRFNTKIEIENPTVEDSIKIINHYLKSKSYVSSIDTIEVSKILNCRSCAELESIINQAGINAGFDGKDSIDFDDIVRASVRVVYDSPKTLRNMTEGNDEHIAYHEAGHAVMSELLEPNSVTLISVREGEGKAGGFTSLYNEERYYSTIDFVENRIRILLAGKCATEIKYGKIDTGFSNDLEDAMYLIKKSINKFASLGFDKCNGTYNYDSSEIQKFFQQKTINDELQRHYQKVKELLVENRDFLDAMATQLTKKKMLVGSEVQEIKRKYSIK